mmetsp:Transcript_11050/g.9785  ORF Transcript_11050/g.9785 Transcript_11050/m.9785 type:complete len:149 (+) Transcript_11050:744-1190(+)
MKISISTTSDDTKKIDSGNFEKEIVLNQIKICPKPPLRKYKSSQVNFRKEFNKTKEESAEDAEFKKLEAQALYEAKIDTEYSMKSSKQILHDTFHEIKSTGKSMNVTMVNKSHSPFNVNRNYTGGRNRDLENEYLRMNNSKSFLQDNH